MLFADLNIDNHNITPNIALVWCHLTRLEDVISGENDKTNAEKCAEVCLTDPHCRSYEFNSNTDGSCVICAPTNQLRV